ncbi:unnamed protein product, partial [Brassica rapa subsp. narinosa]
REEEKDKRLDLFAFMDSMMGKLVLGLVVVVAIFEASGVDAWTGEIRGRVVCDVCADSSIGPEDHVLEGAEVAVLCITKSGEVVNYQAFTNLKGVYTVAETMPESERWDACLARPISSFHTSCNHLNQANNGIKFSYKRPSVRCAQDRPCFHAVKPFVYRHQYAPSYC